MKFTSRLPFVCPEAARRSASGSHARILFQFPGVETFHGSMAKFRIAGYPYACAGLYLLHSTIFFVAAGNPLLRVEDLEIQFPGAILALACTWGGNRLVAHRDKDSSVWRVVP